MNPGDLLRYTLLGDGTSDRALMPVLNWLLSDIAGTIPLDPQWANLGPLSRPEKGLTHRMSLALQYYPCHILFVHRDAERPDAMDERIDEIGRAGSGLPARQSDICRVCVVPVRMFVRTLFVKS